MQMPGRNTIASEGAAEIGQATATDEAMGIGVKHLNEMLDHTARAYLAGRETASRGPENDGNQLMKAIAILSFHCSIGREMGLERADTLSKLLKSAWRPQLKDERNLHITRAMELLEGRINGRTPPTPPETMEQ